MQTDPEDIQLHAKKRLENSTFVIGMCVAGVILIVGVPLWIATKEEVRKAPTTEAKLGGGRPPPCIGLGDQIITLPASHWIASCSRLGKTHTTWKILGKEEIQVEITFKSGSKRVFVDQPKIYVDYAKKLGSKGKEIQRFRFFSRNGTRLWVNTVKRGHPE